MATLVSREALAPGVEGIEQTRSRMVQLIRAGAKDLAVREEATRAVQLVRPHDYSGEIAAVFDYMTGLEAAPYRLDPVDVELLQSPTAPSKGRDCDCMVVKAGAMLESIGHPVRVVIGAPRRPLPGMPPEYRHTWLEVFDRSKRLWIPFDPVLHLRRSGVAAHAGEVLPHAVTKRFPVRGSNISRGGRAHAVGVSGLGEVGELGKLSFKGFRRFIKNFDITDSRKIGGQVLRRALSKVPGGSVVVDAADGLAAARRTIKKVTGVDLSKAARAVASGNKRAVAAMVKGAAGTAINQMAPGVAQQLRSAQAVVHQARQVRAALPRAAAVLPQALPRVAAALPRLPRPPTVQRAASVVARAQQPVAVELLPVEVAPEVDAAAPVAVEVEVSQEAAPPIMELEQESAPAPVLEYEPPGEGSDEPAPLSGFMDRLKARAVRQLRSNGTARALRIARPRGR